IEQVSFVLYWVIVPFVLIGLVVLSRSSWRRLVIVLVPVLVVAVNVALTYGSTRFRVAAEPSLGVLAAVGIVAIADRLRFRSIRHHAVTPSNPPGDQLSETVS